jgi:hypothetical protein
LTSKDLPGERSVGVKSADETEAGEKSGELGDVWTCKGKGAGLWPKGAGELRLSVRRSCSTCCRRKKRSLISTIKKNLGTGKTYCIIVTRTVFFPTIPDGADFSRSLLSRPKNIFSTDNGLYGWVSSLKERIQVILKLCRP